MGDPLIVDKHDHDAMRQCGGMIIQDRQYGYVGWVFPGDNVPDGFDIVADYRR